MTCADVQAKLSLYLYGELDFAAEEEIDEHLNGCSFCQLSLNREKEWHAALNTQQRDASPEYLAACRAELHTRLQAEPVVRTHRVHNFVEGFLDLFHVRATDWSYRLAAASFLVILGFAAGRYLTAAHGTAGDSAGISAALLNTPKVTRVESVAPGTGKSVRIVVQQVGEISGDVQDTRVRQLLLAAAQDSMDPGVRMDSVEILAAQPDTEIRNAIIHTIKTDSSAAVRVRAIESLRRFPPDTTTREALEYVLAHDRDAGVRTEAVDVLVPAGGNLQVTPQLIQTIQGVLGSDEDDYVRERCQRVLASERANGVY
jgi:hypothetical protein